jgi:glycosyltransferase involved in cell wall biosynthesis
MIKNKILIISNGGIALEQDGNAFGNPDTGKLALDLRSKEYDVTYCGGLGDSEKNKFLYTFNLKEHGIRFSIIHGRRPKCYWSIVKLWFLILTHQYIYIYYPGGAFELTAKICNRLGKKYGVYLRGNGNYVSDKFNNRKTKPFQLDNKRLLMKSSYFITVSDYFKLELDGLCKSDNVKVLKPMLDWDLRDIYEKKKYLLNNSINLLFVGSLIELKGIAELISIAEIFERFNYTYNLKIIGDGVLLSDLIDKQRIGKITKNVKFMGAINDRKILAKEYENADIFIFTSRNEGFPRVLYEAMLKSLPIFTTFVGGIPGLMKHNYNCIEIPVRDIEGQAQAIMNGINNPELLQKISKNGLETVKEVLTKRKPHHEVLIGCIEDV